MKPATSIDHGILEHKAGSGLIHLLTTHHIHRICCCRGWPKWTLRQRQALFYLRLSFGIKSLLLLVFLAMQLIFEPTLWILTKNHYNSNMEFIFHSIWRVLCDWYNFKVLFNGYCSLNLFSISKMETAENIALDS